MRRIKLTSIVLSFSILALTSCASSQQYAGSKKDGAFFTVPNGWNQISNSALNKVEGATTDQAALDRLSLVSYQVGYTPTKNMTPKEVFALAPTDQPVIFARFRDLFPEERNAISLNALRDIILPITGYQAGTQKNDRNFQLSDDQEITEKGGKGVSLLYSFDYDGVNETINQTALYSNDQNKIYLFIVRCSTKCYNKNIDQIDKIVKSFTVRGTR